VSSETSVICTSVIDTSVLDRSEGCQPYVVQKEKRTSVMKSGSISIIIPALNEAEALPELLERTNAVLRDLARPYEILVIDDGSTDDTPLVLRELSTRHPHLSVTRFRRNYGKAAALSEAFSRAHGDFLIAMDGDRQDPPEAIPHLLQQLQERYDVVCGWKQHRQDSWGRVLGSRLFNLITGLMTGLRLHDINCGLKGYRRQVVQELRLYGEMHRFIPVIARQRGFLIGELPVQHFPRRFGRSRYGWSRPLSGLFDLITLVMLGRYTHKPLHFFGLLGVGCSGAGLLILSVLGVGWFYGQWIGNRPLFLFSIFLMLSGMQFIFFGLLAELLIYLSGQREDCGIDEEIVGVMTDTEAGAGQRPRGNDVPERPAPSALQS
jgi:glycosyltransferase involved in cell wall biosynthesis